MVTFGEVLLSVYSSTSCHVVPVGGCQNKPVVRLILASGGAGVLEAESPEFGPVNATPKSTPNSITVIKRTVQRIIRNLF
jgi:hypothetical protein